MRLRSPKELSYRLWQEASNLRLLAAPPRLHGLPLPASPLPGLPAGQHVAARLRDTYFAAELARHARSVLDHQIPVLGLTLDTGPVIAWRRDYTTGRETPPVYFKKIPYLDLSIAGDHKTIWELNRHQHLVLLAQYAQFESGPAVVKELWAQLSSWMDQNPMQRGINWASALEVGFRALSWLWIYHLTGDRMPEPFKARFLEVLYQHGRHLAVNLSYYFSPNTHLLGEALALQALGTLMPQFPEAAQWAETGRRTMASELRKQVLQDGAYWEQSSYYHVYALDMFLFHAVLGHSNDPELRQSLQRMGAFLSAVMGPGRELPFLGDDDGGRLFYPFGPRQHFGRASLAACSAWLGRGDWSFTPEDLHPIAAWWMDPAEKGVQAPLTSRLFPDTGLGVMTSGAHHAIMDVGSFGPGGAGHSHADSLSLIVRSGDEELLIDPGTFTYVGDPALRNWFRGTAAHNTIVIDGADQAGIAGPFRWEGRPTVRVISWTNTAECDELDAECAYRGFLHRRRVRLWKVHGVLTVLDQISQGPAGEHEIEQYWHLASLVHRDRLVVESPAEESTAWRSPVFAVKHPVPTVIVRRKQTLPLELGAAVLLDARAGAIAQITHRNGTVQLHCQRPGEEILHITL